MKFILDQHNTVANHFLAELRSTEIQSDRMRFRRNLERIGEILAYEISKKLRYTTTEVETPLGIANVNLSADHIVVATILRAGLPFHQGFLHYFDKADNAFISAYRVHHKSGDFEINLEYVSCPELDNCVLIVCDPMLATGASMVISIEELLKYGTPAQIHIATVVAAMPGVEYVSRNFPDAHLWIGSLDEELTAKSYIVPGLGDAGDLAFGPKMQE